MSPLPNDSTKIYKSYVLFAAYPRFVYDSRLPSANNNRSRSIPFNDQDFIHTATRWTKSRIFAGSSPSSTSTSNVGGPSSPPPVSNSPISLAANDPAHYYARPTIELCHEDGTFLVAYPACAQLWEFKEAAGGYCLTGSTFGINGKVLSAHFVRYKGASTANSTNNTPHATNHPTPLYVVLQVERRDDIQLQVHQLNKKPSFVQTLVLPPASSGPGPYSVYSRHTDQCIAIITKAGAITLFSVPDFHPMALSGLETAVNADGMPLFDICGRWLVYSPVKVQSQAKYTPLKLPPPGLLLDRILENVSTTAAASLKTLSDAGVAGLRHYLSMDTPQPSKKAAMRTSNSVIYVGRKKFDSSALPAALNGLFTGSKSQPIQIMDLETQDVVSTFISPQGLSFLSLSPHDAVLATVSAKGENVFTFDLSFVPRQVSLSGKYTRGKTPGKVSHVEWDSEGGFGIVTSDKGSVHWFERLPWNTYESQVEASSGANTHHGSSKIWRLSGWRVNSMCMIPDTIGSELEPRARDDDVVLPRESSHSSLSSDLSFTSTGKTTLSEVIPKTQIAMLREGEILVVSAKTGTCAWKYDIPSSAIGETFLSTVLQVVPLTNGSTNISTTVAATDLDSDEEEEDDSEGTNDTDHSVATAAPSYRHVSEVEPLSFYEMETCLPYPFLHTDRHIRLGTYGEGDDKAAAAAGDTKPDDWVFGGPLHVQELDFGMARGLATFEDGIDALSDGGHLQNVDVEEEEYESYRATPAKAGSLDGDLLESDVESSSPETTIATGANGESIPWEKKEELMQAMESMVFTET